MCQDLTKEITQLEDLRLCVQQICFALRSSVHDDPAGQEVSPEPPLLPRPALALKARSLMEASLRPALSEFVETFLRQPSEADVVAVDMDGTLQDSIAASSVVEPSETKQSLQSPEVSSPSSLLRPYMKWRPTAVLGTLVTLGSFVAAAWLLANPSSVVRTEASVPKAEIEMGGVMIFDVKAYFLSSLYGSMDSLGRSFAALHDDLSIETNLIMTDYVYTINPHFSLEHNAPGPAQNFIGTIYQNWCIDGKFQLPKAEKRHAESPRRARLRDERGSRWRELDVKAQLEELICPHQSERTSPVAATEQ
ncbi:unnamed protein product [Symbiodinium necroappetens]|uniref:Uncharacterized protein n=1 Tax=Symbiodinium necroappetens TaxID=1628268 RepID=A0A812X1U6_9DINO|nr:unnamed protein product [Symbiodinium necroappetens]